MNVWDTLGLLPTTDQQHIKQAYAAQLKLHRPDRDPAGFQHLREAFDLALAAAARATAVAGDDGAAGNRSDHVFDLADPSAELLTGAFDEAFDDVYEDGDGVDNALLLAPEMRRHQQGMSAILRRIETQLAQPQPFAQPAQWQKIMDVPLLQHFGVRAELANAVFFRVGTYCMDNHQALAGSANAVAVLQLLDRVFDWRGAELALSRYFDLDLVDGMLDLLDGAASVLPELPRAHTRHWRLRLALVGLAAAFSGWLAASAPV